MEQIMEKNKIRVTMTLAEVGSEHTEEALHKMAKTATGVPVYNKQTLPRTQIGTIDSAKVEDGKLIAVLSLAGEFEFYIKEIN
jgi:hypothetical protein